MNEDLFKELGFESAAEFYKMSSDVDLSSAEKMAAFQSWKENDGTKAGLKALPTTNR